MKKIYVKFIPFLVLGGLLFASCKKDDDDVQVQKNEPEFPTTFSEFTVEQNKENLENNGIEMVNSLTEMKNTKGIKAAISFSIFAEEAPLPENKRTIYSNQGISILNLMGRFGRGKVTATKTLSGMRVAAEDSVNTMAEWQKNIGVYAYNATKKAWDYTKTGDKIVFKFPSSRANAAVNDVIFSVYDFTSTSISNDALFGDVPSGIKADLTINGVKELEYSFTAAYNSAGDPTSVKSDLTLGPFKYLIVGSNSSTEVSADYTLSKGDKNLLALGARATGTFTSKNAFNSEKVGNVVTKSSGYFQIMNIKFSGEADVKEIEAGLDAAADIDAELVVLNAHYKVIVFYADSKKKIAGSEFYKKVETYSDYVCRYNSVTKKTECKDEEVTDTYSDLRLVFADGSKSDLENYVQTGFDDITKQFDLFIEDLKKDLNQ